MLHFLKSFAVIVVLVAGLGLADKGVKDKEK